MPGYNITGPSEAFATTLEDAMLKHEVALHQSKIAERQAKLDQAKLQQDKAYLELAQKNQEAQQEDRKTALAEKAAAAKEKEGTDIAGRLVTGDVITPDIAKVLPPGLTIPGAPGTPAIPAGSSAPVLPGAEAPVSMPGAAPAAPAVAPTPDTFRGLPAARIAAQQKTAQDKYITGLPHTPEGEQARQAYEAESVGLKTPPSAFKIAGAGPVNEPVMRINPRTGKVEQIGEAPKGAHFITEPKAEKAPEDASIDLSPAGLDMAALMYFKTGTLPPMGMGPVGAKIRSRVISRAAEIDPATGAFSKEAHETPDVALNKSDLHANATALTKLQSQHSAVNAFSAAASHNADLLEQTLKNLPDSGVTWVNRPLREAATAFGSENMAAFNVFRKSLQDEYSRIISNPNLTGVLSDTAREEMATILSPSSTVSQIKESLKALKAESKNREKGIQGEIDVLRGRIKGGPPKAAGETPSDAGDAAYAAYVQSQGAK
jgi:hypothetical protein